MNWQYSKLPFFLGTFESLAKNYGYSISLGGSMAHKGESSNDLDLIVFDLKTSAKPDHKGFIKDFIDKFEFKILGVADHSKLGDEKLVYKLKTSDNKKIDLLFVNLKFQDRIEKVNVLVRKEDYRK